MEQNKLYCCALKEKSIEKTKVQALINSLLHFIQDETISGTNEQSGQCSNSVKGHLFADMSFNSNSLT